MIFGWPKVRALRPQTPGDPVVGYEWGSGQLRVREPVRGGSERITFGVSEHPGGRDREHRCLAPAVGVAEVAAASDPLPPPVPLCGERGGDPAEHGIVGHLYRVTFHDDVQAAVPPVAAGGEHHVGVGAQVDELLLVGTGGKPDGSLRPGGDDWGDVRPAVGAHGRDPEQLGPLQRSAGLLPPDGGRGRGAVSLVELGDRGRHRHLPSWRAALCLLAVDLGQLLPDTTGQRRRNHRPSGRSADPRDESGPAQVSFCRGSSRYTGVWWSLRALIISSKLPVRFRTYSWATPSCRMCASRLPASRPDHSSRLASSTPTPLQPVIRAAMS